MKNFDPLMIPRVGFHDKRAHKKQRSARRKQSPVTPMGWQEFLLHAHQLSRPCRLLGRTVKMVSFPLTFGALAIGTGHNG
jgi:hypothetical protein